MCNECENKKHEEINLDNIVKPFYNLIPKNKKSLIETHPNLVEEWDWIENDKLGIKPENVSFGSHEKVWWICPDCKKNYDIVIKNRTTQNQNCPYCSGRRACLENCLATLRPDLAKEWDYKNNKTLTPFDITCGSGKMVWWLCPDCNESYDMRIGDRTNKNKNCNCPFCSGKKVCLWNCLDTLRPDIAAEWDYKENKTLTPFNVTCGSAKKVYWICPDCNKSYDAIISNRTKKENPTNCPYCIGQKVCLENCLATLRPGVARQWHPTLNENLTPYDVTLNSGKKVFWMCEFGHEWKTSINNRTTKNPTSCPECKIYYHEVMCREIMKEIFNKEFNKYKNETLKNKFGLELDCYNEELKINIEYDGPQHFEFYPPFHKTKEKFIRQQENDRIKDQWCANNNILQIRVSYKYDTKEEIETYIKEQLALNNRLPIIPLEVLVEPSEQLEL